MEMNKIFLQAEMLLVIVLCFIGEEDKSQIILDRVHKYFESKQTEDSCIDFLFHEYIKLMDKVDSMNEYIRKNKVGDDK